jgi:DNA-binding MarR family transcriptional regulator
MLWKRAHERVRLAIAADVTREIALTEPDLLVLVHLDVAGGSMRQNAIVAALGWDRSRASHHLTRMAERGLVERGKLPVGVEISLSAAARRLIEESRPLLEAAAQRHLTSRLTDADAAHLRRILGTLLAEDG